MENLIMVLDGERCGITLEEIFVEWMMLKSMAFIDSHSQHDIYSLALARCLFNHSTKSEILDPSWIRCFTHARTKSRDAVAKDCKTPDPVILLTMCNCQQSFCTFYYSVLCGNTQYLQDCPGVTRSTSL
jgi:hypothetical protein